MGDPVALRRAFAAFLGREQFRKFVEQGWFRGRLRFWQEQAWGRFVAEHPEFAIELGEMEAVFRICHLHGVELQSGYADVFHGCRNLTQSYIEVRSRLFPRAALDPVSTEAQSFEGGRVGVWFCPSCRRAAEAWHDEYRAVPRVAGLPHNIDKSMLRMAMTLDDYFTARTTSKRALRRPRVREYWEEQRAVVEEYLRHGDELWVWQDGEFLGARGGVAIVRNGEVAHAWLHWFS